MYVLENYSFNWAPIVLIIAIYESLIVQISKILYF